MTDFNDFNNPQVAKLPKHLKQFIVNQHYEKYTSVDQAVWRYVMRQNYRYLKDVAYYPYIKGLARAGLSIERIPDLQTVNNNLNELGWGAVTVNGFIPPAAFMEFQAYRVLVIAADIRQLKHIAYTPAPDIIHESAGHAPIIADADYNNYLSYFGSIGVKAMFSAQDFKLYEAIRHLSILKEAVNIQEIEIEKAENKVKHLSENLGEPSEMALLSRLHWWTVEYGLIGTLADPKIYGAGLLSSIGESASCCDPKIKKIPYTIEAINYNYDITQTQPQLFVTPNFQNLVNVLEQFANTMAFRRGGTESMQKAIACKNITTAVYSSGLQVTGLFTEIGIGEQNQLTRLKTTGSTVLAFDNKQLAGHGKLQHKDGFSSPVGKLKGMEIPLEDCSLEELKTLGIAIGELAVFTFESDIQVKGKVKSIIQKDGKTILITLEDCTVKENNGNVLFQPEWGVYDMAVGEKILSVFNGAADKEAFEEPPYLLNKPDAEIIYDEDTHMLHQIYAKVREGRVQQNGQAELPALFEFLKNEYPDDWLCSLEILEILHHRKLFPELEMQVRAYLQQMMVEKPKLEKLITDGLLMIENPVTQLITEQEL